MSVPLLNAPCRRRRLRSLTFRSNSHHLTFTHYFSRRNVLANHHLVWRVDGDPAGHTFPVPQS